jgi:hypothetical protein
MLAPICHPLRVEELESKVEAAEFAVLLEVSAQLVAQSVRVTPLERPCGIVR